MFIFILRFLSINLKHFLDVRFPFFGLRSIIVVKGAGRRSKRKFFYSILFPFRALLSMEMTMTSNGQVAAKLLSFSSRWTLRDHPLHLSNIYLQARGRCLTSVTSLFDSWEVERIRKPNLCSGQRWNVAEIESCGELRVADGTLRLCQHF